MHNIIIDCRVSYPGQCTSTLYAVGQGWTIHIITANNMNPMTSNALEVKTQNITPKLGYIDLILCSSTEPFSCLEIS